MNHADDFSRRRSNHKRQTMLWMWSELSTSLKGIGVSPFGPLLWLSVSVPMCKRLDLWKQSYKQDSHHTPMTIFYKRLPAIIIRKATPNNTPPPQQQQQQQLTTVESSITYSSIYIHLQLLFDFVPLFQEEQSQSQNVTF